MFKISEILIAAGLTLSIVTLHGQSSPALAALKPTPKQVEGPYFLPDSPYTDNLIPPGSQGMSMQISGKVLATDGKPISGATIHIWLADPQGAYDNQDASGAPVDIPPSQQKLRGRVVTGAQGEYSFKSLRPGNYSLGNGQMRPAHIHILIEAKGYKTLITQLYFADDPWNKHDIKGPDFFQPELIVPMTVAPASLGVDKTGAFDFVLAK